MKHLQETLPWRQVIPERSWRRCKLYRQKEIPDLVPGVGIQPPQRSASGPGSGTHCGDGTMAHGHRKRKYAEVNLDNRDISDDAQSTNEGFEAYGVGFLTAQALKRFMYFKLVYVFLY